MKRMTGMILALLLLTGCGRAGGGRIQTTETETTGTSAAETTTTPLPSEVTEETAAAPLLSESSPEDWRMEAKTQDFDLTTNTRYYLEGEITEEAHREKIWEMLCKAEDYPAVPTGEEYFDGYGGDVQIRLTNTVTGVVCEICEGIFYENQAVDGGASVLIFRFSTGEARAYYDQVTPYWALRDAMTEEGLVSATETVPVPPEDDLHGIAVIHRYSNYAWGKVDRGTFYNRYGDLYSFDFSELDLEDSAAFLEAIEECEKTGPIIAFGASTELLEQIVSLADSADPESKLEYVRNEMCDYGEHYYYAVSHDGQLIPLCGDGDNIYENPDVFAKQAADLLQYLGF